MAGYDKALGEKNFMALNDAIKDLLNKREQDIILITKLRDDMNKMRVMVDTMNQTLNVYKALSMGNGATT